MRENKADTEMGGRNRKGKRNAEWAIEKERKKDKKKEERK